MRIKNIFSITCLVTLVAIVFASCEERHYWQGGSLERVETFVTDPRGEIHGSFRIEWRNIYSDGYGSIEDIRYLGYEEVALSVASNDILHEVWLSIPGTNAELGYRNIQKTKVFYGDDESYFMEVIVDQLRRYGSVIIDVDAVNDYRYSNIFLDIQLLADVEVYMRD